MAATIPQPVCSYPPDPNFPDTCSIAWDQVYCCTESDPNDFIACMGYGCVDECSVGITECNMTFPFCNDDLKPMLKTTLNATAQVPWVKIAFEQYGKNGIFDPNCTAATILTMGNISQPGSQEQCRAAIRDFQYGWGTVNQGNTCRITIVDEKGSGFEQWVERIARNPEADSTPIAGKNRMKVQWGWYITGGGDFDVCGQPAGPPLTTDSDTPALGENSSYIVCSPVLYFMPTWVNVQYENGKFIYNVEGVDTMLVGQDQMNSKVYGTDKNKMYFTKACEQLGKDSTPPFRVQFKALDQGGNVVDMQFVERDGANDDRQCKSGSDCERYDFDCRGWGPVDVWACNEKPPLAVIHNWIISYGVAALDLTGKVVTNRGRVGITMNYDPSHKVESPGDPDACPYPFECTNELPQYGILTLWANGIPACQDNFTDEEINDRMKAVYVVNGGNCQWYLSEVLTEDGWNYIGNIYRKKYAGNVACIDENGNLTWSKITNWYRNILNNRKMIKIHLHNSRQRAGSISGAIFTEDHPILTNKGYVEVKDLKITEHLIHSGTYCPSQEVHEAVVGMMLGDGYIRRKNFSFNCTHYGKQKEYIEHKAKLLGLQTVNKPDKKYSKIKITSKTTPYWRSLRKLFCPDGIKVVNKKILENFTIISLAFLYMDDGSLYQKKKLAEIATCCFTNKEVDLLIEKIKEFGVNCYRRKNSTYPRIYFNRKETVKLCKILAPYIVPSMDYKLLPQYRLENKENLNTEKRPFYDNFNLIRCEYLENKTKYVYCIDVEKYHNFITHSGVVHNCSPVLQFNPAFKWHFALGEKAAGAGFPTSGNQQKATAAAVKNNCPVAPGRGIIKDLVIATTNLALRIIDPKLAAQVTKQNQIAANLGIAAIEADLRVQGDPSDWLCSPITGYGRCVGIVFINPFFLVDGLPGSDCPVWAANEPGDPGLLSVCNRILTNKGWFVRGADHQIRDGSYVTTLKLQLLAPGAEITQVGKNGDVTKLGGWPPGIALPFAGLAANIYDYITGNSGTAWEGGQACAICPECVDGAGCIKWVGVGEAGGEYSFDSTMPCPQLIDLA